MALPYDLPGQIFLVGMLALILWKIRKESMKTQINNTKKKNGL